MLEFKLPACNHHSLANERETANTSQASFFVDYYVINAVWVCLKRRRNCNVLQLVVQRGSMLLIISNIRPQGSITSCRGKCSTEMKLFPVLSGEIEINATNSSFTFIIYFHTIEDNQTISLAFKNSSCQPNGLHGIVDIYTVQFSGSQGSIAAFTANGLDHFL